MFREPASNDLATVRATCRIQLIRLVNETEGNNMFEWMFVWECVMGGGMY